MIEFKDVTGDVLGVPGKHFFKQDHITDEAIQGYLDRGAELVKIDRVSHAHALKLMTAATSYKAKERLSQVPEENELENPTITRLRLTRQKTVDKARKADKAAEDAVNKAQNPKTVGRPKGT